MRPLTSSLLDLLRISAAAGVVVSHLATARLGRPVPILESMGHACVAVFFVLSGYVIAWVTDVRETGPNSYTAARLSRLYSVLIPALLVTGLLDYISLHLDPEFFYSVVHPADLSVENYLRSLLFLNQTFGNDYAPGSNSPMWSLGYEAPYYAMFAVFVFMRGLMRLAGVAVLAVLTGPAIWVLFPVWLMGAGLYRLIGRRNPTDRTALVAAGLFICLAVAAPWLARWQTNLYAVEAASADWVKMGHSNQFLIFYVIGLFVCCIIVFVDYAGSLTNKEFARVRSLIAYMAGSTFSIYLFHYPVLVLLYASTHYERTSATSVLIVFSVTIGICFALSFISERRKRFWSVPIESLLRIPLKRDDPVG